MLNDSVVIVVILCLLVPDVSGLSVWVSRILHDRPEQIVARDVYSGLTSSTTAISLRTWINIPRQEVTSKGRIFSIRSSEAPTTVIPLWSIVNSSYATIEVTTTASGESNEIQLFPYPLAFDEWVFVEIIIRSGASRSVTTNMIYPDGQLRTATHFLQGDMLIGQRADLVMTASDPFLKMVHAFLAYFAVDQHPSGYEDVISTLPNQIYSMKDSSGGQIFEQSSAALNISCLVPGSVISSIEFASFGRPYGVYPDFIINFDCHSNITMEIIRAACHGKSSCNIRPETRIFGDPCPGHRKSLAVVANCRSSGDREERYALFSPLDVSPLFTPASQLHFLDSGQTSLMQAVNVSIQIIFDSESNALTPALMTFANVFSNELNTTTNRIINAGVQSLRYPVSLFTFTLLPPTSLYDMVSAQRLAQKFNDSMQMTEADSSLRRLTLLAGAPQPPVPLSIVDVILRICGGTYVYVQSDQDPCTVNADSGFHLSSLAVGAIAAVALVGLGALIGGGVVALNRRNRPSIQVQSAVEFPWRENANPIVFSMPSRITDSSSPSNFSVVKSGPVERLPSNQSKLSTRNFPMRIERLAAIGKPSYQNKPGYQTTDSETDSAFLSDVNHLSIESGPAPVVEYFTDSS